MSKIFVRETSGLVRELSMIDLAFYGILNGVSAGTIFFFFPYNQGMFPGSSATLVLFIAPILIVTFVAAVYAAIGSAMPRSGGDYVFTSRLFHPAIGFAISLEGIMLGSSLFFVFGGYAISYLAITPYMQLVGSLYNNPSLVSLGNWLTTSEGYLTLVFLTTVLSVFIGVLGMRWWRRIQDYIIMPIIFIGTALMIILPLVTPVGSFKYIFNTWGARLMGDPNLYDTVLETAYANGFTGTPPFNLYRSWMLLTVPGIYLAYVAYGAMGVFGEVKHANSFKKSFLSMLISGLFGAWVMLLIPVYLFENMIGQEFLNAFAFVYYNGLIAFPLEPNIPSFVMMLTDNPFIMIFIPLSITFGLLGACTSMVLNGTRVLFAASLDRVLPEWFSKISKRFRAPINAGIFMLFWASIMNVLFCYWEEFYNMVVLASALSYAGVFIPIAISAIFFPWKLKEVYKVSPVSRYKVLGVPLVTIIGTCLLIIMSAIFITIFIEPDLGGFALGQISVPLFWLLGTIYFYFRRWYMYGKGIEIDYAFKEVPPG